jgi:hypothetical protein
MSTRRVWYREPYRHSLSAKGIKTTGKTRAGSVTLDHFIPPEKEIGECDIEVIVVPTGPPGREKQRTMHRLMRDGTELGIFYAGYYYDYDKDEGSEPEIIFYPEAKQLDDSDYVFATSSGIPVISDLSYDIDDISFLISKLSEYPGDHPRPSMKNFELVGDTLYADVPFMHRPPGEENVLLKYDQLTYTIDRKKVGEIHRTPGGIPMFMPSVSECFVGSELSQIKNVMMEM